MLYGIQRAEQLRLAQAGYRCDVLVSYGSFWFPWFMRRLAERPANILFLARNFFGGLVFIRGEQNICGAISGMVISGTDLRNIEARANLVSLGFCFVGCRCWLSRRWFWLRRRRRLLSGDVTNRLRLTFWHRGSRQRLIDGQHSIAMDHDAESPVAGLDGRSIFVKSGEEIRIAFKVLCALVVRLLHREIQRDTFAVGGHDVLHKPGYNS